jgi:hypothetical protein
MTDNDKQKWKTIIDRVPMMSHPQGCPACGQKFNLGDPAVFACGTWGREAKLIHESDAVFDAVSQT